MIRRKMNIKNFVFTIAAISAIGIIVISVLSYSFELSYNRYRLLKLDTSQEVQSNSIKNILFWTKFHDDQLWGMSEETYDESYLENLGCSVSNCVFTHNKNYLKSSHLYDAIIFHSAENWWYKNDDIPSIRSPHQLYIMSSLESPGEIKHNLKLDREFYNLTMTYRLDSDIIWPYGYVKDKSTNQVIAPGYDPNWRGVDDDNDYLGESCIHSDVSQVR